MPLKGLSRNFLLNKAEIFGQVGFSEYEFDELASLIFDVIEFVPLDEYKQFLPKAKELLGEHEKMRILLRSAS